MMDTSVTLVLDVARLRAARILYHELNTSPVELTEEQSAAEGAKIQARLATMSDDDAACYQAIWEARYGRRPEPVLTQFEQDYLAGRVGRVYEPRQYRRRLSGLLRAARKSWGRGSVRPRASRPRSSRRRVSVSQARAPARRDDDPEPPPLGRFLAALARLLGRGSQ